MNEHITKKLIIEKINWETIYYHEELDTHGYLLEIEWIQEAIYRNGFLIKHYLKQGNKRPHITLKSIKAK